MSLIIQLEPVEHCWNEWVALASQHSAESQGYRRHEPFNVSFDRYNACNKSGFLHFFIARDGARMAGYATIYITNSMHSQKKMAVEDTFFLHPEYRKGRNALRFIQHVEQQCRAWGVEEMLFSCEDDNKSGIKRLLEYLDFSPVIVQYSKQLTVPVLPADSGVSNQETTADVSA